MRNYFKAAGALMMALLLSGCTGDVVSTQSESALADGTKEEYAGEADHTSQENASKDGLEAQQEQIKATVEEYLKTYFAQLMVIGNNQYNVGAGTVLDVSISRSPGTEGEHLYITATKEENKSVKWQDYCIYSYEYDKIVPSYPPDTEPMGWFVWRTWKDEDAILIEEDSEQMIYEEWLQWQVTLDEPEKVLTGSMTDEKQTICELFEKRMASDTVYLVDSLASEEVSYPVITKVWILDFGIMLTGETRLYTVWTGTDGHLFIADYYYNDFYKEETMKLSPNCYYWEPDYLEELYQETSVSAGVYSRYRNSALELAQGADGSIEIVYNQWGENHISLPADDTFEEYKDYLEQYAIASYTIQEEAH